MTIGHNKMGHTGDLDKSYQNWRWDRSWTEDISRAHMKGKVKISVLKSTRGEGLPTMKQKLTCDQDRLS